MGFSIRSDYYYASAQHDVLNSLSYVSAARLSPKILHGGAQVSDYRADEAEIVVPWGAINLSIFLTLFGAASFVAAWLHITQVVLGKEQAVRCSAKFSVHRNFPEPILESDRSDFD